MMRNTKKKKRENRGKKEKMEHLILGSQIYQISYIQKSNFYKDLSHNLSGNLPYTDFKCTALHKPACV